MDEAAAVVAEEEIELLSSVFCLNGESCRLIAKEPCILIQVTISIKSSIFSISFELDSRYPNSAPPSISILCQQLSRNASHALANRLRESAQKELLGKSNFFMHKESTEQRILYRIADAVAALPDR